ncbi:MAG: hypothetical protein RL385_1450 [Pseudomonadota bacterium]
MNPKRVLPAAELREELGTEVAGITGVVEEPAGLRERVDDARTFRADSARALICIEAFVTEMRACSADILRVGGAEVREEDVVSTVAAVAAGKPERDEQ